MKLKAGTKLKITSRDGEIDGRWERNFHGFSVGEVVTVTEDWGNSKQMDGVHARNSSFGQILYPCHFKLDNPMNMENK